MIFDGLKQKHIIKTIKNTLTKKQQKIRKIKKIKKLDINLVFRW